MTFTTNVSTRKADVSVLETAGILHTKQSIGFTQNGFCQKTLAENALMTEVT